MAKRKGIQTLFDVVDDVKNKADRASRRVGAAGGKAKREGDDVYSVADPAAPGGRRRARGAAGAAKSGKTDEVKELTTRGRKRIAAGAAAGAGAATLTATRGGEQKKPSGKKKEKDYTKGVSRGGVPFKEAFAKARKDGKKTFLNVMPPSKINGGMSGT